MKYASLCASQLLDFYLTCLPYLQFSICAFLPLCYYSPSHAIPSSLLYPTSCRALACQLYPLFRRRMPTAPATDLLVMPATRFHFITMETFHCVACKYHHRPLPGYPACEGRHYHCTIVRCAVYCRCSWPAVTPYLLRLPFVTILLPWVSAIQADTTLATAHHLREPYQPAAAFHKYHRPVCHC